MISIPFSFDFFNLSFEYIYFSKFHQFIQSLNLLILYAKLIKAINHINPCSLLINQREIKVHVNLVTVLGILEVMRLWLIFSLLFCMKKTMFFRALTIQKQLKQTRLILKQKRKTQDRLVLKTKSSKNCVTKISRYEQYFKTQQLSQVQMFNSC